LAIESSGTILVPAKDVDFVSSFDPGILYRIDPARGPTVNKSVVSDFSNPAQGPLGSDNLFGIAIEESGSALVVDVIGGGAFGPAESGVLFRVDTNSGNRTLLSDFGNPAQGPVGFRPIGITIDSSGSILVIDPLYRTEDEGLLFRVHPISGNRTVISDFSNSGQGPLGREPIGVAVDSDGQFLVTDREAGTDNKGLLFRIDPTSGNRVILSDFSDSAQGPTGCSPTGITIDESGNILVADSGSESGEECSGGFKGVLFSIDPSTGNRIIVSDFNDSAQGPLGENPTSVVVGPSRKRVPIEVNVDIKPKTDKNRINPNGDGQIRVAILTTDSFDAASVDSKTVRFGATGMEAAPVDVALRDPNHDGQRDLILTFQIQDTGINCGDTSASLTGQTFTGFSILGSNPIRTVGCKKQQ
jgi:hypothetical protein